MSRREEKEGFKKLQIFSLKNLGKQKKLLLLHPVSLRSQTKEKVKSLKELLKTSGTREIGNRVYQKLAREKRRRKKTIPNRN